MLIVPMFSIESSSNKNSVSKLALTYHYSGDFKKIPVCNNNILFDGIMYGFDLESESKKLNHVLI